MPINMGRDDRAMQINQKLITLANELCQVNGFSCCYILVGINNGPVVETIDGHAGAWPIPLGTILGAVSNRVDDSPSAKKMWS